MRALQAVCVSVGAVLFLWFLMPIILYGIINIGNITGMILSGVVLIYGFNIYSINALLVNTFTNIFGRILISFIGVALISIFVVVLFITCKMIGVQKSEVPDNSTAIVLGCRVYDDGPGIMLTERINAAYDYLCMNEDAVCILSGGQGPDEPISEAECMYRCLTAKGISGTRLYKEDRSTSTEENLLLSSKIIMERGLGENAVIITSDFHAYRAVKNARKLGVECKAFSAKTNLILLPTYYVRELLCIVAEMILK